MKRYAKIVQTDSRGQIVIPKEVRQELGLEDRAGFYIYVIENEGLFLGQIPLKELSDHSKAIETLKQNSAKLKLNKKNIDKSIQNYRRTKKGNFELV